MIRVPVLSLTLCLAAWPAGAQPTITSCGTGPRPCKQVMDWKPTTGTMAMVMNGTGGVYINWKSVEAVASDQGADEMLRIQARLLLAARDGTWKPLADGD